MRSRNVPYLPGVDHVRAFASLLIVFYHTEHFVWARLVTHGPPRPGQHVPAAGPLQALVVEGHTAVALFMVLSGFIFTYGTLGREVGYRAFLRNRLLRIYPLFVFLILVGSAVHPAAVRLEGLGLTLLGLANQPASLQLGYVSAMFWTVALETQFYLIFPFLLAFANRGGARPLLAVVATALVFRAIAFGLGAKMHPLTYTTLLGRIDAFVVGMLVAMVFRSPRYREALWRWLLLPAFGLVLALLCAFHAGGGLSAEAPWRIVWPTAEAAAWGLVLLGWLALAPRLPGPVSRMLAAVGTISYSTYLVHFVLVHLLVSHGWIAASGAGIHARAALTATLVVLPCVLAVASLTWWAIERPFLELRQVYLR